MYNIDEAVDKLNTLNVNHQKRAVLAEAYNAGWAACYEQHKMGIERYLELQKRATQAEGDLRDFKRIWDTENIGDRLETYTEGYRQRADLVMDMQQQVLNAEKRIKNSAEWEKDAYRQRDEWQARAEAAEAKIADLVRALFPDQFPDTNASWSDLSPLLVDEYGDPF